MRRRWLFTGLCALLVSPGALYAKKPDKWIEVHSPHFHIISNDKPKKVMRTTKQLEEYRHLLSLMFTTMRLDPPTPTRVILFKNTKSFQVYEPLTADGKPAELAGFMQPGRERMYLAVNLGRRHAMKTAFHEYIHLIVRLNFDELPLWLEEGLAEFYQETEIRGRRVSLGGIFREAGDVLRRYDLIPVGEMVHADRRSPYYRPGRKRDQFYAQSWLLIHFLMAADKGKRRPQLEQFLKLLKRGLSQDEAFPTAFGTDYAGMHRQLRGYLRRMVLNRFEGKLEKEFEQGELEHAPLSAGLAQAYLADLWLNSGRIPEAARALEEVAARDSNEPEILYRLGRIALEQEEPGKAERHFRAALALRPDDIGLRYYTALAINNKQLGGPGNAEDRHRAASEVIELLTPVLETQSEFSFAYHLVIQARLARDDPPDEVIPVVEKARQSMPQRQDFDLLLADLYERAERWQDAEKTLQELARRSPRERQRRQARDWLERLRERRERLAAVQEVKPNPVLETSRARMGVPVEPPAAPAPVSPPRVAYLRGRLVNVDCQDDEAVVTVQPDKKDGESPAAVQLAVRSRSRLLVLDPTESGHKVGCGPAGIPVAVNYRVEPRGPTVAGVIITIELHPPAPP